MENTKTAPLLRSPNQILLAIYKAACDRVLQTPTLDYLQCGLSDITNTHGDCLHLCHNQIRGLFFPLCAALYKEAVVDEYLKSEQPRLIILWEKVYLFLQEGPYASDAQVLDKEHYPYEALSQSIQQLQKIVEPLELIHFEAILTKQSGLIYLLNTWLSHFSKDQQAANAFLP